MIRRIIKTQVFTVNQVTEIGSQEELVTLITAAPATAPMHWETM